MSDEPTNEKCRIPQLREHGITDWLDEFKGYLMRHKRAHLAIDSTRPQRNDAKVAELAAGLNPETALRRYLADLKEQQEDWDERNDIAISNLIESTKEASNSEARQIIFDNFKNNLSAKEICNMLIKRFDSVDPRVVNAMIRRWTSLKIIPGERATSFITRLNEVKENLRKKGKTYTDGELVGRLLEGLKDESRYAMSVAAMETVKGLTWEDAVTQLQTKDTAEFVEPDAGTETAAMATAYAPSSRSGEGSGDDKCQICKKSGHLASKCRFRYDKKEEKADKGKRKDNSNFKEKNKKNIKCFNCGKQGHYANECRLPDKRKADDTKKRKHGDTDESENKRAKTNGSGSWDKDEFSGMMREKKGARS